MTRWMPIVMLAVVACGSEPTDEERGEALWEAIQGWEDWNQVEPWDGIRNSSDCTHGPYVQITYNDLAADNIGSTQPDGAIIVKRGHDAPDGSAPVGFVTVMQKIEGYDPDNGDWFWLRVSDDGTLSDTELGSASFCYGCHSAGGQDYLLTTRDTPPTDNACIDE